MGDYVLGTDPEEIRRLQLQQEVWGEVTGAFLDRLGIAPGWRVLDAGCGPGLVTRVLRERVGEGGEVHGLDQSEAYLSELSREVTEHDWRNVHVHAGDLATVTADELGGGGFDLVFLRWVLSFQPRVSEVVGHLARLLSPGGVIAIQDYNHEGVSLFPESEGFRAVVRATRELYASRGGDAWVAGHLPRVFAKVGLETVDYTPTVLCGGPSSGAYRWANEFFTYHAERMHEAGVLRREELELFRTEWAERREDPTAVFFSPIVVDVAGRYDTESHTRLRFLRR